MSKLKATLSQTWFTIQSSLFPWLAEELGELTAKQQELVTTLEMIRVEEFILSSHGYPGRRPEDRVAIARAFVAKMVYNMPTTRALLDRLDSSLPTHTHLVKEKMFSLFAPSFMLELRSL